MDEYKKLKNQPLKFVLAEFRFSQIMQIGEYIPRLQEALRRQYPIFDKTTEQAFHLQPGGLNVIASDRWSFKSANKKSAIEVSQERIIYYTSEYPRFEGFTEACRRALDTLTKLVEPNLILRIGLRYGDLVQVGKNETISDLVDSHFAFPECVASLGNPSHQRGETVLSTEIGRLAIRTLYGHHDLSFLPDIQGLPVVIDGSKSSSERMILDFDHFWEAGDEVVIFDVDNIMEKLNLLHETSREAFWRITTDYARDEKWA